MARYDKVDSAIGVFRAVAAADEAEANYDKVLGVSLDASGLALTDGTAGNSGFVGVTTRDRTTRKAGAILDCMTNGEIVECEGLVAGTRYYIQADGTLGTTVTNDYAGHTVEADRLVVRLALGGTVV